mmetsp:Transcript_94983/g.188158  ORF Transcript_94983/g.188158 Transcript_94983/m.188158 type:complete len:126 (-) Transcript_94983:75-452(-)
MVRRIVPPLDPSTLSTAGVPTITYFGRRPSSGLGSSRSLGSAGGLVTAGQTAAWASSSSLDDVGIAAGLAASHGAWRPERPLQTAAHVQSLSQVVPAGMPSSRRPCIGRLAHHITLQSAQGLIRP